MGLIEGMFTPDMLGKIFAFLCALFWALAVILFKKSGEAMKPLSLNLYKSLVSTLLLIPVLILAGVDLLPEGLFARDYLILIVSGIIGIAISDTLFFKSLNLLGAGLTAIVDCLYSPIIILLSFLILLNPVSFMELTGGLLVISAILVATLKVKEKERSTRDLLFGFLYGAAAMTFMGFSVTIMKPVLDRASSLWVTELRLIAGTIALIVMVMFNKDRRELFTSLIRRSNFKYAFPATILGSFLALVLWVSAFKMTSINSAAILNQTNTIFIVIFASFFLKEKFTFRRLLATILGMGGSVVVLLG
ncbi:MAG: DMT family transporter [Acidobacteriota bacterium]